MTAATVCDLFGLLLAPAVVLVALLAHPRSPRLAGLAGVVAFVGYGCLSVAAAEDFLLKAASSASDRAAAVSTVNAFSHVGVVEVMIGVYVAGHLVGILLLSFALWRSRAVPRWAAVAVAALIPFEVLEQATGSHVLGAVGYALVTLAFVACVRDVLGLSTPSAFPSLEPLAVQE